MPASGRVDVSTTEFCSGWVNAPSHDETIYVLVILGSQTIGMAAATFTRPDLERGLAEGKPRRLAFTVVYDRPIAPEDLARVRICTAHDGANLDISPRCAAGSRQPLKVFVCGSPRSGTSQMGETISKTLDLRWYGETHAAPILAAAAKALAKRGPDSGVTRFIAEQHFDNVMIAMTRQIYFATHSSNGFLDKTPGIEMISSLPFIQSCFPDSRFIFMRRSPVANILSRLKKFGGDMERHCRDWTAAMMAWREVQPTLRTWVEIEQEEMLTHPERIGERIAAFLDANEHAASLTNSLRSGSTQHTGAGLGRTRLSDSGWCADEIELFKRICAPAIEAYGYQV